MSPTPPAARRLRRFLFVSLACGALAFARAASAQAINEPPRLPVVIVVFPSMDGMEAQGFDDNVAVDISVIRNGAVVGSIAGAHSTGGLLDVNVLGGVCWEGVTPDIRPGDIVRFAQQGGPTDQVHVMPIVIGRPIQIPGGVEIHGTASDLNGSPIPLANIDQRIVSATPFAVNGRKTLRAGAGNLDGTFEYDAVNNPTGTQFTVRYTGLGAGDIQLAMAGEMRLRWLGAIPANANELTIYQNDAGAIGGPFAAGGCTAPLGDLDTTAPSRPGTFASTLTGPAARSFTWAASTDDVLLGGYELLRDGVVIRRLGPLATSTTDAGIPAGPHTWSVVAFDHGSPLGAGATLVDRLVAAYGQPWGNRSVPNTLTFIQPDIVSPTAPTTVTVATGNGKALPSWGGATDNVGVVAYGVYRNNLLIATVPAPATTYKDSGLVTGTYNYSVDAVDAAGLRSAKTAPVAASVIFIPDTTPPTVPGGFTATVTPDVHGRTAVIRWNAATDSMGVTGYRLFRNGAQLAVLPPTQLAFTDASLATATYTYRVDAFDAANNHSAQSLAGVAVIANDPPLAPHVLVARPSQDAIAASGYPAAQGPYTFTLLRGATTVTSVPVNADAAGNIAVNLAGGGCWSGMTPNLRAGDVIRITDGAGTAEQTTIADLATQLAVPAGTAVIVHGVAQDAAGNPLPMSQLEHRLVVASGAFERNGSAALVASGADGGDGTIAYDAAGSTHWTATYPGLSAADIARAVGTSSVPAASSQLRWLGRTPAEQSLAETAALVGGGPVAGCGTPAESPAAVASFFPGAVGFADVSAIPPAVSLAKTIEIQNTGNTTLTVYGVYLGGLHAADYTITSAAPPATLAPGAFFTVDVVFAPQALGPRQARLCLASDAPGATALMVTLDGNGVTDVTPPTTPAALTVSTPDPRGHEAFLAWGAATDSVGVTGYTVYRDGGAIATLPGSALAYHDVDLEAGPHTYRVDAFDLQNNHSPQSAAARAVIAHEPPAPAHVLVTHPARDQVTADGFDAANGPFVVEVFRAGRHFVSVPVDADGGGRVQVNGAAGGCWSGTTPNLRAGDIVRITDANGNADQTQVANVVALPAAALDSATVVVHGMADDGAGNPLPLAQLDHQLVLAAGTFDRTGMAFLHADAIAYDAPGSTRWTAMYSNLTPADVLKAAGSHDAGTPVVPAAESQGLWLGAGTGQTVFESGSGVLGGGDAACGAALESPAARAAFMPAAVQFGRQGLGAVAEAQPVIFQNTGDAPMAVHDVRVTGLHAGDFEIVSELPAVIPPNSAAVVRVAFHPAALGARQAAVTLASDAANTATISAPLAGTGWSGLVIKAPGRPTAVIVPGSQLSPAGAARTLPVTLRWGPSLSPEVDHYDLQQSVNNGPFVDAPVQPGSLTELTVALPVPAAGAPPLLRFRVRAAGAGQASEWVAGAGFGLEPVDDLDLTRCAIGGPWGSDVQAEAWAGSERKTLSGGARIELKPGAAFRTAGSIAWLTTMGPDRGLASVQVDDRDSVVVDLRADAVKIGAVGFVATNLVAGQPHRIVVRSLGRRSVLSTGYRVDADGFLVLDAPAQPMAASLDRTRGGNLVAAEAPAPPAALDFRRIAPNPTRGSTVITFALPREGAVELDVLDVAGRRIARVVDAVLPAGEHRVAWDGRAANASALRSGVYFAVLRYGGESVVRRVLLLQ